MPLVAVRFIDIAIFGSLGTLWIGGFIFIVVLYRWLLRYEREQGPTTPDALVVEQPKPEPEPEPERVAHRGLPSPATAREALATHP